MIEATSKTIPHFKNFAEFWPFYLKEHSNPTNRRLHFIGTTLTFVVLIASLILAKPALLWLIPLVGYGFAWVGHFIIEKNRPATFKHPLWSLRGDFKMYFMKLAGTLNKDLERLQIRLQ